MSTATNVIPFQRPNLGLLDFDPVSTRLLPEQKAADECDSTIRALEALHKRSYILRGLTLLEMERRALWRFLRDWEGEYHSIDDYIQRVMLFSRSSGRAAIKAAKDLADIPVEDLADVSGVNIAILQRLPSKVRTKPDVIEAAQHMQEKAFVEKIDREYPEYHMTADRDDWEEAVKLCMAHEECGRTEAKQLIAKFYISNHMGE